jgi:hypothetical protein
MASLILARARSRICAIQPNRPPADWRHVKWIDEAKDWVDKPITGDEARWLRIAGLVLVAPFMALIALSTVLLAAATVFGIVGLVYLAIEHGLWFIPTGVLAAWLALALIPYAWDRR